MQAQIRFRIDCLGDFALRDLAPDPIAPPRGRKARALVALLARAAGNRLGRDKLIDLLWSARGEPQARASLRQTLFELRAYVHASPALIVAGRERVALGPAAFLTDIDALVAAARIDDLPTMLALIGDGGATLLGDLDGIDPVLDEWLTAERARLRDAIVASALAAAERGVSAGDTAAGHALMLRLEALDPANEPLARALMRADGVRGDLGAAFARFDRLGETLQREYGTRPSDETRALRLELRPSEPTAPAASAWVARSVARPLPPLLAITPLVTLGDGADARLLADGATDDLLVELARYRDLRVMFLPAADDPGLEAAAVGAVAVFVLTGSVREERGRARANLKLASASGAVVWAEQVLMDLDDFAGAIRAIVARVVGAAGPAIDREMLSVGRHLLPEDPSALVTYYRARALVRGGRTYDDARRAADLLEAAIAGDPLIVTARLELARLYNTDFDHRLAGHDIAPLRARALALAAGAVAIDPRDAVAHVLLGWCQLRAHRWDDARAHFAEALALHPHSACVHDYVAVGTMYLGDLAAARRLLDRATELNPAPDPDYPFDRSVLAMFEGGHAAAERGFRDFPTSVPHYRLLRIANLGLLDGNAHLIARLRGELAQHVATIWAPGVPLTREAADRWLAGHMPVRLAEHRALLERALATKWPRAA